MKGSSLLLLLVFVAAGYVLHPMVIASLRDSGFVAEGTKEVSADVPAVKKVEGKKVVDLPKVDVDLSGVTGEDFPDSVTLLRAVNVKLPGVQSEVEIPAGADVKPVGLEGDVLIFEPTGIQTTGRIEIELTNFKQKIKPILDEKARLASAKPDPVVEPQPQPAPEPTSEPAAEPKPKVAVLDEAKAVELMQSSVKAGAVKEFSFDQVLGWKLEGTENLDGEEYQIGMVVYNAETLFGEQKLQVKALIKDGKVVRWVWAKTGVEVR